MFWDSWQSIGQILILGVVTYPALVLMLRFSGKRTLSKFNAFDFVITIAFGSIVAAILLNSTVTFSEGIAALAVLIGLQFAMTWLSVRSEKWRNILKSEPALLFHNGQYLNAVMKRERIPKEEILAALRENGSTENSTGAVVLETNGTFSVLPRDADVGSEDIPVLRKVRS